MATRVDNKGQKTTYGYDGYGRLTQIRHYPDGTNEDIAQEVNLFYDNTYTGSGPNTWGRLAAATNSHVKEVYGYTAAGLLTSKQMGVSPSGGQVVLRDSGAEVNYAASSPRKDGAAIPEAPPYFASRAR
jgi:YD repeat-containing protein